MHSIGASGKTGLPDGLCVMSNKMAFQFIFVPAH
jgi:hypothetical protein